MSIPLNLVAFASEAATWVRRVFICGWFLVSPLFLFPVLGQTKPAGMDKGGQCWGASGPEIHWHVPGTAPRVHTCHPLPSSRELRRLPYFVDVETQVR